MRTYSSRQVLFISVAVAVLTVGAVAAFRMSPLYHSARRLVAGFGVLHGDLTHVSRRGPRLTSAEVTAMRKTYSDIVKARSEKVDQASIDQIMRAYREDRIQRSLHWFGIPTEKNPTDAWMMQQLIAEIRPDYIVETGTWRGGSALFFATILEGCGLYDSRIATIDIENSVLDATGEHPFYERHVEAIIGSSIDPTVVAKVTERVKGKRVMVFLDSLHNKEHVLAELKAYAPLVSPGSYIIVEDTHLDSIIWPDGAPGPFAAVEAFLGSTPRPPFQRDLSREVFMVTNNPGGYLRRDS